MSIYKIENKLEHVKDVAFKYEKDIQKLVEENLSTLLKLDFICSEFALNNFRIDTLGFDNGSKSFVIIEYKRDRSFSVIDQGYAYLSLMLNNKADFILEYNEKQNQSLKRNDVDWTQSKVIFISPSFTNYQKEAINFKDLPIEIWEIKRFENNTISFEQIQKTSAKESIKTISKVDETVEKVSEEIKVYTEQDHFSKIELETKELYEELKEHLFNMDSNISIKAKKQTIGFNINNNVFCDITLLTKELKIYINLKSGELKDSRKIARDVSNVGHWGNGSYEVRMNNIEDMDYILSLLKQSLIKNN